MMCCTNCCTAEIEYEPAPQEVLAKKHNAECIGIQVQGNTAKFCSCITPTLQASIIQLRENNYRDIEERILKASEGGFVDVGDVQFLISENRKWS